MGRPKLFDPDEAVARAMELFWDKGYSATTPQDLVDGIGIGRGSLYNAFGGKHDLYERALRRYYEHSSQWLVDVLDRPGTARERVRGLLEEIAADPSGRGCMFVNAGMDAGGRDDVVDRLVRRGFDRLEGALKSVIEDGQRDGEIDSGKDPLALAGLLLTTVNGLRVLTKADRDDKRLARVVKAALDLL
ncbi:TetR/AcrR family transcriptional regulator [Allokutzneria oryzae]|uniref:TetR/AcrR family transcriptional regulator n=1 Tax=Allokutzneria oryzae TaxID=1378989 RepID=A0ABV6ABN3_9PSEU